MPFTGLIRVWRRDLFTVLPLAGGAFSPHCNKKFWSRSYLLAETPSERRGIVDFRVARELDGEKQAIGTAA